MTKPTPTQRIISEYIVLFALYVLIYLGWGRAILKWVLLFSLGITLIGLVNNRLKDENEND